MRLHFIFAGALATLFGVAQAGELYKWVDKSGKVHYSDTRVTDVPEVEKKKFGDSAETEDADLSFEARRAKQNFPATLYIADNCDEPCKEARNLLNKRGIPHTEKKLLTQEEIDAFKQASGFSSVPALSVGKNWLKGFNAEKWHNELDAAGYPKISSYRQKAKPQPSASPSVSKPEMAP